MEFLIVLAVVAITVIVVSAPLRRSHQPQPEPQQPPVRERDPNALAELEAARAAKYREIRDAELDHRTGKLSDADYEVIDAALRSEAIEILRAIDHVRGT